MMNRGGVGLLVVVLAAWAGCSDGDGDDEKPTVDAAVVTDTSPDPDWNHGNTDLDAGSDDAGDAGGDSEVAEPFWTIAIIPDTQ